MTERKLLKVQLPRVPKVLSLEPQWTVEPNLQAIEQTIQLLLPSSMVQVTFLAQGAFNKIYNMNIDNEVYIMQVTLPVDPYYKTMSEMSTMDRISHTINIPVPQVITCQSS